MRASASHPEAPNVAAQALVALGTNLPHAGLSGPTLLAAAMRDMIASGLHITAISGVWETAPWPDADQPDYVNAVVAVRVDRHTPASLYRELVSIERAYGRARRTRWDSRTLDLDLLDFAGEIGMVDGVETPHPRLHERAFVLAPLAEIAPGWRHPVLGLSAAELLAALPPGQQVRLLGSFQETAGLRIAEAAPPD